MLPHRLCKQINQCVVCVHECVGRDNESRIRLVENAADVKAFFH